MHPTFKVNQMSLRPHPPRHKKGRAQTRASCTVQGAALTVKQQRRSSKLNPVRNRNLLSQLMGVHLKANMKGAVPPSTTTTENLMRNQGCADVILWDLLLSWDLLQQGIFRNFPF